MAALPVSVYAAVFLIDRSNIEAVSPRARRMMRTRSLKTIGIFSAAAIAALVYPIAVMALICFCLVLNLRPEAPGKTTVGHIEGSENE